MSSCQSEIDAPEGMLELLLDAPVTVQGRSLPPRPLPVRFHPLGSGGSRRGQALVQKRNSLFGAPMPANRVDPSAAAQSDLLNNHFKAQDFALERQPEAILDHGEETHGLIVLVVAVDRGLGDHVRDLLLAWFLAAPTGAGLWN